MNPASPGRPRQVQFLYMLLLIGYFVLGALIMEQNQVIQNQKLLIRVLYQDSAQLTAYRLRDGVQKYQRSHPDSKH
jgi:hypothetical protein